MPNYFKDNIAYIRKQLKLTQTAFGRRVGKTDGTISAWESGTRSPTINDADKVARTFGYDGTELLFTDLSANTNSNVSAKDQKLLDMYHRLEPEAQQTVTTLIELLLK